LAPPFSKVAFWLHLSQRWLFGSTFLKGGFLAPPFSKVAFWLNLF